MQYAVLLLHILKTLNLLGRGSARDPFKYTALDQIGRNFAYGRRKCFDIGRDIAQVNSKEENEEAVEAAKEKGCTSFFLGRGYLSPEEPSNHLVQISYPQENSVYSNYGPGEPFYGFAKNYVVKVVSSKWYLKKPSETACTVCGPLFYTLPGEFIIMKRAVCADQNTIGYGLVSLEDCKLKCSKNFRCMGFARLVNQDIPFYECELLSKCSPTFTLQLPELYEVYLKHSGKEGISTSAATGATTTVTIEYTTKNGSTGSDYTGTTNPAATTDQGQLSLFFIIGGAVVIVVIVATCASCMCLKQLFKEEKEDDIVSSPESSDSDASGPRKRRSRSSTQPGSSKESSPSLEKESETSAVNVSVSED